MRPHLLPTLMLALAAACVPPAATPVTPVTIATPFTASDVAWSKDSGSATIDGQAFLKTRGGDVKYGAGNAVLLLPESPYFTAWYNANKGHHDIQVGLDRVAKQYVRQTTSDGAGKFSFSDLPPGKYYLVTTVTWEVPGPYYSTSVQGGVVGAEASAEKGKTVNVIISTF